MITVLFKRIDKALGVNRYVDTSVLYLMVMSKCRFGISSINLYNTMEKDLK